jgi:putative transposon-encoded protein
MKPFDWNEEKNKCLKRERDVSFEQVVFSIENGKLLDIIRHPSQTKHKGQRVYVIEFEGYAYKKRENEYTHIAKRSEAPRNKGNGRRDAVSNPGFKHHS